MEMPSIAAIYLPQTKEGGPTPVSTPGSTPICGSYMRYLVPHCKSFTVHDIKHEFVKVVMYYNTGMPYERNRCDRADAEFAEYFDFVSICHGGTAVERMRDFVPYGTAEDEPLPEHVYFKCPWGVEDKESFATCHMYMYMCMDMDM